MSFILNIDCSHGEASVSISQNGEILTVLANDVQRDHAAFIHISIAEILIRTGLQLKDIDAIASVIGPGSYTGLRVGLAAAKGLCYALNKPLISVGTLDAMALTAIQLQQNNTYMYCPMIDARRMEVYTALYNADKLEIMKPQALILDENSFSEHLKINKIFFFGSGLQKWKDICIDSNTYFLNIGETYTALSSLSFQKFSKKNFADLSLTVPLYTKEFFYK